VHLAAAQTAVDPIATRDAPKTVFVTAEGAAQTPQIQAWFPPHSQEPPLGSLTAETSYVAQRTGVFAQYQRSYSLASIAGRVLSASPRTRAGRATGNRPTTRLGTADVCRARYASRFQGRSHDLPEREVDPSQNSQFEPYGQAANCAV
jgi:hypothetical protein